MKKNYFYITSLFFLFSLSVSAQEGKDSALASKQEQPFEMNVYPNPVANGKIYISSKTSTPKDIEIYDVLGKRVMQTTLSTKELNIAALNPGVYIIKIKDGEQRATRKLIVK
ncbi:T9SS type A sorting domain-containing protein [Flavobacterium amnicola]|uniref:T9SS type A sorting domain-containing protein n=1 Tax=Flavobacterium amnicola TaxID=2506422 RepID=A0A4Q1K5H5_9FLAO|nr:T9SS type A sorting domain-containing protein [Flavobacterium amnicola]RXR20750.1 T9SS type A sorting domain-containing protein [Flavobacterium amnicola]